MSNDDWKAKLERGERLPLDLELTEYVLKTIGISPNKVNAVLTSLLAKGRDTWGSLLDLDDREEAIKLTGGDVVSGKRIWSVVQEQKAAGTAAAVAAGKLSVFI